MATSVLSSNNLHFTSDGSTTHVKATASTDTLTLVGDSSAKVTLAGLADPSASDHAVSLGWAQQAITAAAEGLHVKAACRAATTAAKTLASDFASGSVIDGVTLATGNRILIKNQANKKENGIYVVNASGAPTRADDFDSTTNALPGSHTFIEVGTVNADKGFVCITNGTITPDATSGTEIEFSQFSAGVTDITAGDLISISGSSTKTIQHDSAFISKISGNGGVQIGKVGGAKNLTVADDSSVFTVGATATTKTVIQGSGTILVGNGNTEITSSSMTADTVTSTSDERLKTDIVEITDAVEKVKKLKGVHFSWKESGAADAGVIAQDVEQVCPHWVKENDKGIKSVDYSKLSSLLIQVVKEQQSDIDELKAAVAALQSA